MICMEEAGMKKELFKTVLSLVGIFLWIYICQIICRGLGLSEWYFYWMMAGFPFGMYRMCLWIIPRHYDMSGTLGVLAFSCIVSSVLGGTLLFMKVIESICRVISLCLGN